MDTFSPKPCFQRWEKRNFSETFILLSKLVGTTLSDRLQKLQNRAARAIVGRKNEHGQSELALNELNWKPLSERRTQFVHGKSYV